MQKIINRFLLIFAVIFIGCSYGPAFGDDMVSGSGFFINKQGALATAAHVVGKRTHFVIKIGKKYIPARVLAVDYFHDVAILTTDRAPEGYFKLRTSSQYPIPVTLYGFPMPDVYGYGLHQASGTGNIRRYPTTTYVASNAYMCEGVSGGPIVVPDGTVIGVETRSWGAPCSDMSEGPVISYIVDLAVSRGVDITLENDLTNENKQGRIKYNSVVMIIAW